MRNFVANSMVTTRARENCFELIFLMKYFSKKVGKSTFQGYIPLSLIPLGGLMVRERGIPQRINRTALDAMMAPGPLGNAIMSCFRVVPLRPRPVGSDQRGRGRKTWGGRSPRGNGMGVPPSNGVAVPGPPFQNTERRFGENNFPQIARNHSQ